jgi:hypothetical protein
LIREDIPIIKGVGITQNRLSQACILCPRGGTTLGKQRSVSKLIETSLPEIIHLDSSQLSASLLFSARKYKFKDLEKTGILEKGIVNIGFLLNRKSISFHF